MNLSKVKGLAAALVLTMAAGASAQFNSPTNARMMGMAGAPMNDISGVFNYPVLMMGYPDHIQATFPNGGLLGIKQVNEGFFLGLSANQGRMCPSFTQNVLGGLGNNIPHLLLGFNAGSLNIGADVFFEYDAASETYTVDNQNGGTKEVTDKGYVLNTGVRLSAGIDLENMSLLAKFGIGLPSFYSEEYPDPDFDPNLMVKNSNKKGVYVETGAEVGLPLAGLDWKGGFEYTFVNYNLHDGTAGESFWDSKLDIYLGFEFNFLETAVAALGYTFTREAYTEIEETPADQANNQPKVVYEDMGGDHYHTFSLGMENIWDDVWIFDAFALRAGASYQISVPVSKSTLDGDLLYKSSEMGTHSPVRPVMGIGVSKSFLTLDLALQMGNWSNGIISGPTAGLVTGTIKF